MRCAIEEGERGVAVQFDVIVRRASSVIPALHEPVLALAEGEELAAVGFAAPVVARVAVLPPVAERRSGPAARADRDATLAPPERARAIAVPLDVDGLGRLEQAQRGRARRLDAFLPWRSRSRRFRCSPRVECALMRAPSLSHHAPLRSGRCSSRSAGRTTARAPSSARRRAKAASAAAGSCQPSARRSPCSLVAGAVEVIATASPHTGAVSVHVSSRARHCSTKRRRARDGTREMHLPRDRVRRGAVGSALRRSSSVSVIAMVAAARPSDASARARRSIAGRRRKSTGSIVVAGDESSTSTACRAATVASTGRRTSSPRASRHASSPSAPHRRSTSSLSSAANAPAVPMPSAASVARSSPSIGMSASGAGARYAASPPAGTMNAASTLVRLPGAAHVAARAATHELRRDPRAGMPRARDLRERAHEHPLAAHRLEPVRADPPEPRLVHGRRHLRARDEKMRGELGDRARDRRVIPIENLERGAAGARLERRHPAAHARARGGARDCAQLAVAHERDERIIPRRRCGAYGVEAWIRRGFCASAR